MPGSPKKGVQDHSSAPLPTTLSDINGKIIFQLRERSGSHPEPNGWLASSPSSGSQDHSVVVEYGRTVSPTADSYQADAAHFGMPLQGFAGPVIREFPQPPSSDTNNCSVM